MSNYSQHAASGSSQYGYRQIDVVNIYMQEIGTYDPQYMRPWQYVGDAQVRNQFADHLERTRNGVTAAGLAGMASRILQPATRAGDMAQIAGGWNERRFRFSATIRIVLLDDNEYYCELIGYTDHYGIAGVRGEHLDPNMVFHVNTIVKRTMTSFHVPGRGRSVRSRYMGADQIINRHSRVNDRGQRRDDTWLQRPSDLIHIMQVQEIQNDDDDDRSFYERHEDKNTRPNTFEDFGFSCSVQGALSNRTNTSPTRMLADTLGEYRTTVTAPDGPGDIINALEDVKSRVCSPEIDNDTVLRWLTPDASYMTPLNEITWRQWIKADPDVVRKIEIIELDARQLAKLDRPGEYMSWDTQLAETIFSKYVATALPAFMSSYLASGVSFTATNMVPGGGVDFKWVNINPMVEDGMTEDAANGLKRAIIVEVLGSASKNNLLEYYIEVNSSLYGATKIRCSLMGGPMSDYAELTVADGAFSPNMATDPNTVHALASGIHDLFGVIDDVANRGKITYEHDDYSMRINADRSFGSGGTARESNNQSPMIRTAFDL